MNSTATFRTDTPVSHPNLLSHSEQAGNGEKNLINIRISPRGLSLRQKRQVNISFGNSDRRRK